MPFHAADVDLRTHVHPRASTSLQVLDNKIIGAEEGTRTPTPLRVHGPEPCASANSATPASDLKSDPRAALKEETTATILTRLEPSVKLGTLRNVRHM